MLRNNNNFYIKQSIIFFVLQGTREMLRKHVEEFGDLIRKENEVGLIIDGKVNLLIDFSAYVNVQVV